MIEGIQNVYQRGVALQRRLRLRELYPEGIVPYIKKLEYDGTIASTIGPCATVAPPVTKSFRRKYPLELYEKREYTYDFQHMLYIGKMDAYSFNTSVPKFDPWFRSVLKARAPDLVAHLENTYMRDPCTPERITRHIALFDRTWLSKPNDIFMHQAEQIVKDLFAPVGQVEPIDFNYAGWMEILPHLDMTSSPGLPLRREYHTQGECLGHIYDKTKRLNHFAKFLPPPSVRAPPCMIGVRPGLIRRDELDSKIKARGVWAYPAEVKVMEMRFCVPLMKRMSSVFGKIPYLTGRNMNKALPFCIDHLLNDGNFGFVTDVSKLDTSIGPDYIDWAFALLASFFHMGITASSVKRNESVFDFLKYYFKRTPILLPSGQLVRKQGGVPSGSGFTQLVDTLVTTLFTVYTMLRMGYTRADIEGKIFVVGDDMATSVPEDFDVPKFVELAGELGFDINLSKVMFSNKGIELKFLGYSKYGGGIFRPPEELLQGAFFPEKFVGNQDRARQRILGQTIASGLCSGFLSKVNYWMADLDLQRPFDPGESYIPQNRWLRNVLGIEELPTSTIVFDLYPLV
ncbi:RNA-dependent RNA polymerase [Penicillium brasilianum partitivirus 1]|nr:RNA-dependent RNA polymerase [Penicillium brasilianum partitivirus 1]